jgi:hypothetical protein
MARPLSVISRIPLQRQVPSCTPAQRVFRWLFLLIQTVRRTEEVITVRTNPVFALQRSSYDQSKSRDSNTDRLLRRQAKIRQLSSRICLYGSAVALGATSFTLARLRNPRAFKGGLPLVLVVLTFWLCCCIPCYNPVEMFVAALTS